MSTGIIELPKAFAIPCSDIDLWSVQSFFSIRWDWPDEYVRPLDDALVRKKDEVDKDEHPFETLQLVTIRFGGRMEPRDTSGKTKFKGKLYFAEPGDVVYSKIDLRNGAIGVVSDDLGRVAVSNEFPVYEVDTAVALPQYVRLLFQTRQFKALVNSMISGASGRKRVTPDQLEALEVPLPPLDVQAAIVERSRAARAEASALHERAAELEGTLPNLVRDATGLSELPPPPRKKAFAVPWSSIDRWAISHVLESSVDLYPPDTKYPIVRLGDTVSDLENGWSPKCPARVAEEDEWGVLKVGAVSFGSYNASENKVLSSKLKPKPQYEVAAGDVLIGRANVLRLVGACAFVEQTRPKLMMCDKIFRVVFPEDAELDKRYLAEVMKLPRLRRQIEMMATGSSPTMKNISKESLLDLRLPLPPVDVQQEIVEQIDEHRRSVRRFKTEARSIIRDSRKKIESMILGKEPAIAA